MATINKSNIQYYINSGLINPQKVKIDLNKTKTANDNAHRWVTLAHAIKSGYDFNFDYDVPEIKTPKVNTLPEVEVTGSASKEKSSKESSYNKGIDMFAGANYSPSFNKHFYGTSDFDALFGKSRVEGVKKAWQSNPQSMQNWTDGGNIAAAMIAAPFAAEAFGAAYSVPEIAGALNLYGAYEGLGRLTSEEGVAKTVRKVQEGDLGGAAKSFGGDVLDITMSLPFLNRIRQLGSQGYEALSASSNIYRKIPFRNEAYYRILSDSHGDLASNAIADAEGVGIIRSNPKGSWIANGDREHFIGPYFSKGKPWGSIPKEGKVIVGESDIPGTNWMEISPHATELIEAPGSTQFTPVYNGTPNSTPTKYFHYFERGSGPISKHFWFRRNFKPQVDPTLTPQSRFRVGDVEVNDPNLAYRQQNNVLEDFFEKGYVRSLSDERPQMLGRFNLQKSFSRPMFSQGRLWYDHTNVMSGGTPRMKDLLVTKQPLQFANKNARPIKVDDGGRRIPLFDEQLTPKNTSAYRWEDGYGFRRFPQQPVIQFPIFTK